MPFNRGGRRSYSRSRRHHCLLDHSEIVRLAPSGEYQQALRLPKSRYRPTRIGGHQGRDQIQRALIIIPIHHDHNLCIVDLPHLAVLPTKLGDGRRRIIRTSGFGERFNGQQSGGQIRPTTHGFVQPRISERRTSVARDSKMPGRLIVTTNHLLRSTDRVMRSPILRLAFQDRFEQTNGLVGPAFLKANFREHSDGIGIDVGWNDGGLRDCHGGINVPLLRHPPGGPPFHVSGDRIQNHRLLNVRPSVLKVTLIVISPAPEIHRSGPIRIESKTPGIALDGEAWPIMGKIEISKSFPSVGIVDRRSEACQLCFHRRLHAHVVLIEISGRGNTGASPIHARGTGHRSRFIASRSEEERPSHRDAGSACQNELLRHSEGTNRRKNLSVH